jgi:DNA-binding transcriptional MerR regulator
LVAAAERTPAGYRLYDEAALERLRFIARAKQLGLPLEEIRDLPATIPKMTAGGSPYEQSSII